MIFLSLVILLNLYLMFKCWWRSSWAEQSDLLTDIFILWWWLNTLTSDNICTGVQCTYYAIQVCALQFTLAHYNTLLCNAIQQVCGLQVTLVHYNILLCNAIQQVCTLQFTLVHYNTLLCNAIQQVCALQVTLVHYNTLLTALQ